MARQVAAALKLRFNDLSARCVAESSTVVRNRKYDRMVSQCGLLLPVPTLAIKKKHSWRLQLPTVPATVGGREWERLRQELGSGQGNAKESPR